MEEEGKLTVKIENSQPIELIDLTEAFFSLGEQYKRFVRRNPEPALPENIKLYIKEVRSGSIIIDLIAFAPLALQFMRDTNTVASFTRYLKDSYDFFLRRKKSEEIYEKTDYKQLSKLIDIVAKDSGSNIYVYNTNVNGTVHQSFHMNSLEANAAQNMIGQELAKIESAQTNSYNKVLLYFYQARNDAQSQTGDKGIIEKVSKIPKKVIFENEEIKKTILGTSVNPFHLAYLVDVDVETVEDKPVLYKITAFHESFEKSKE